ncbi:hypothetical protein [Mariniplasma anaerobium]|uniref:Uncharacterized protein n=1 Tax=Mariniplasma anaerobium TaxID=2735436 RepID=A0A7U9XUI0_9MOLU|nr:hypothetical protein [Mariniplasma anaerobium]BCR35780.1 hypothetical protein MPAN_006730 [Mariniplasma anaerobium]
MKKFLIIYIIISLLFGVAIYFVTLTLAYNQRVYDVYYELADEAVATLDFDDFISMQSISYQKIHREETDSYTIDVYHVIGKNDETYINQFGLFIVPTQEVDFALDVEDLDDQTGIRVIKLNGEDANETIYETYTEPSYEGAAVSYGLSLMSFYFYAIDFDEDLELEIELYDYNGDMFANFNQNIISQQYPDLDDGFSPGMDADYLAELIDQDTYVYPKLIRNMTIFIVSDIILGSLIYFFIKRKNQ